MQDGRVTVGRTLRTNWFLGVLVAFLIALPFIVAELTGSSPYGIERGSRIIMRGESAFWMALLIEVFALTVFVMSYNLMFGFTGVISFGHALFFGLGGYTIGMLLQYTALDPNLALVLAVLLTLVLTGLSALLIGLATVRLRGVYFAIFTLAVAEMVWIFVGRWAVTNGEDGFAIDRLPAWIDPSSNRLTLYYIGLFLFVFTFLFIRRIVNSPTGSVFQAIRENEDRARAIGFHTLRYKLLAIVIAGMMAGGAGMLHGMLNKKVGPEMFSVAYTVDALLMTIIGGVGTFTGPVLGTAGLHLTETLTRDVVIPLGFADIRVGDSWLLIQGLIFIIVVMVFPFGLVGSWHRLRMRFTRRPPAKSPKTPSEKAKNAS
jgi:branched-chain amino acid transport system permease protein